MLIYILIVLLFLLCIVDFWRNKKFFSPSFVFNAIWFVTLFLYQFKLSNIQQDFNDRTVFIFFVCVISYNLVLLILNLIDFRKDKNLEAVKEKKGFMHDIKNIFDRILTKKSIDEKVKYAKYLVIIIFVLEIIYSGGVPLIWKIIGADKIYFDFGVPSLHGAFNGLVICLGAYTLFTKSKDKFLYFGIGVLLISRQIILSLLIEAVVFELCRNKNIKLYIKKFLIIAIIVVIGFTVIGNFRSGNNVMDRVFQAKEEYTGLPDSVKWFYSYMTFSFSNFNNLVSITDGGVNYGVSMLKELLPTVVLDMVNVEENKSFNYLISLNYNVSTYLPNIYLDFGIGGVGIFNALMAILGYYLYRKLEINNSTKNRLLYSVFIHNIVFIFFINMFLYLPIIVQFIYIPILFSEKEVNNE